MKSVVDRRQWTHTCCQFDARWTRLAFLICVGLLTTVDGALQAQPPTSPSTETPAESNGADELPPPATSPAATPNPGTTRSQFSTANTDSTSSFFRGNRLVAGQSRAKMAPNMIGDFFGSTSTPVCIVPFETLALPTEFVGGNARLTGPVGSFTGVNVRTFRPDGLGLATPNGRIFEFQNGFPRAFPQDQYTGLVETNGNSQNIIDAGPFSAENTGRFAILDQASQIEVGNRLFAIFGEAEVVSVASPSSGGVVGRSKLAENGSPIPRDRVFMNYSYFDAAALTPNGIPVHRFTPGFEKTFLEGRASWELRAPFASTLNTDIRTDGITDDGNGEFGNLTNYFKYLFTIDDTWAYAIGLGVTAPTGGDVNLVTPLGATVLQIRNDSFHVLPFLASLYTPNDQLFVQTFIQYDIDTNGNRVELSDVDGNGQPTGALQQIGRANDTTFLYMSCSAGYWMYRDNSGQRRITGFAPMLELHYNQSLQGQDVVFGSNNAGTIYQIGTGSRNLQVINLTMGATTLLGRSSSLTAAFVTPLGNNLDQQFNGELRLLFNWYFGQ